MDRRDFIAFSGAAAMLPLGAAFAQAKAHRIDVHHQLAKLYYDTAQGNHAGALAALTKVAPVSQLLYGTDYPFGDGAEVSAGLGAYFSGADLRAIDRDNALELMPRLKS